MDNLTIQLTVPLSDKDLIEDNLDQDKREAYEEMVNKENPRLADKDSLLASDYFKAGWDAAIKKYAISSSSCN